MTELGSHLREAFRVIDAWGFAYKTMLTWGEQKIGVGDWLRGQTEHCLLAIRGRPTVVHTNQSTLLLANTREHSRKPDEFYELVESLCPGSKLELFSHNHEKAGLLTATGSSSDARRGLPVQL